MALLKQSKQATADPESIQLNGDIALDFLDQKQKNTKPREGALLFLEKDDYQQLYISITTKAQKKTSFKLESNILNVFDKKKTDGKATIELISPHIYILISKAKVAELDKFMPIMQKLKNDPLFARRLELYGDPNVNQKKGTDGKQGKKKNDGLQQVAQRIEQEEEERQKEDNENENESGNDDLFEKHEYGSDERELDGNEQEGEEDELSDLDVKQSKRQNKSNNGGEKQSNKRKHAEIVEQESDDEAMEDNSGVERRIQKSQNSGSIWKRKRF